MALWSSELQSCWMIAADYIAAYSQSTLWLCCMFVADYLYACLLFIYWLDFGWTCRPPFVLSALCCYSSEMTQELRWKSEKTKPALKLGVNYLEVEYSELPNHCWILNVCLTFSEYKPPPPQFFSLERKAIYVHWRLCHQGHLILDYMSHHTDF